ncbi:MAG: phospholipase D-like domain-containing protein [Bacteroidia bacterium]
MSNNLILKNIWPILTREVKRSASKCFVGVAYFGQNGARMLPLKKGSILVVDASERALKAGQTCPNELLNLYHKGVHIYSKEGLHAKLYLIGNILYCGSANVSGNSENYLTECLLRTKDKKAIADTKTFILSLCRLELGENEIREMSKHYRRPKMLGGLRKLYSKSNSTNFHVVNLKLKDWSAYELKEAEKGRTIAYRHRKNKSRHRVEEFSWSGKNVSFKKGDNILQITRDINNTYVTPVGKLIYMKKWNNGKRAGHICWVEVPNKRRKTLQVVKKQLGNSNARFLLRGGKKKTEFENSLIEIWK